MQKNQIKTYLIIALSVVVIILLYSHFSKPKNVVLTDITNIPKQETTQIVANDSIKGATQSSIVITMLKTIQFLQSDNQKLLSKIAKIEPEYVLRYNETLIQGEVIGELKDSLSKTIDSLLFAKGTMTNKDSFEIFKKLLLSKRIPYEITDNKWRFEKGSFSLAGDIRSDSLKIVSKPFVTFGEKGGFLKRPTISTLVGNENPFMSQDSIQSFIYRPKERVKPTLTAIGLSDGKSITVGAGVNLKYGPVSFTIGYTLFNKTF